MCAWCTRSIPRCALDISLRLGNEIGIVFGASGAGKTTLLRLIAGLARPHFGHGRAGGATLFDSERGDQSSRCAGGGSA